jgi:anti-sigma B factor antagonist
LEEQMSFFYISDDAMLDGVEYCDDVVVVVAGGELDYAASPQLRERLAGPVNAGARRVVVDLSKVSFIDSTAIGVLVGAAMRMQELGGGSLAAICAAENERVLRIFEIAGVDSVIALYHSREEAVSALATAG